jgi:hypothetical protein
MIFGKDKDGFILYYIHSIKPDARASEWIFDKFAPGREHATMRQLIPSYHHQLVSAARSSRL